MDLKVIKEKERGKKGERSLANARGGDCLVCLDASYGLDVVYVASYPNKEKMPCCDLCCRVAANRLRLTLYVHNPEASDLGLYQCIVTDAVNRQAERDYGA